jgi:Cu2+-exporting ATPase
VNTNPQNTQTVTLGVTGMTCAACAVSLEKHLGGKSGIESVSVNYPNESLRMIYHEDQIGIEDIDKAVREIGYGTVAGDNKVRLATQKSDSDQRLKDLQAKLIVAIALTLPVFVMSMFFMGRIPFQNWILMALTIPVMVYSGAEFFVTAVRKARHGTTNMDTLVALSTGAAFLFSAFNTVYPEYFASRGIPPHVYYESAAVIISLILLGRYLEERAKRKTTASIRSLMDLQPQIATVVRNGEEVKLPLEEIIKGDLVLVRPGERMPVDGMVKTGSSYVDESMLTGESVPVVKQRKDKVFSGTINQKGSLKILATEVGTNTLLARIINSVQDAQASKPPIQNLVDRISAIFVPVVIGIALASAAIWFVWGPEPQISYAFLTLITVLIIACPCALGLATPTALMVGIGRAAETGILIRDAAVLEVAYKSDVLLVDKTGTITRGEPSVTDMFWSNLGQLEEWKSILLAIENESEHPLAEAIVQRLQADGVEAATLTDFQSVTGRGVEAKAGEKVWRAGNRDFLVEAGIKIAEPMRQRADSWQENARTVIFFADEEECRGLIAVSDEIKAGAKEAIDELKSLGIRVVMLTGDNASVAKNIAQSAGIDEYKAGMLPSDKGAFVRKMKEEGHTVIMAGDGINDSEALALADMGIAMGSGTDIAMESAGITLMNSDLGQIPRAIRLSRATLKTIRQNLFWAFIYNVIGIPLAAGVLYPAFEFLLDPMIGGAAMAFSSVSVVLNSLRLRKVKI